MYGNCVHTRCKNVLQTEGLTVYTILLAILALVQQSSGQTHNNTLQIFKDKLSSDKYNIQVRPILDQSQPVHVNVSFDILSIIGVSDVNQQFHCNGFLRVQWYDELVAWDISHYGDQVLIHPLPKDVWRPRVVLINTLGDRDIFEDDNAPMIMFHDGHTTWLPGSLFSTSCDLDMTKYPYDEQICTISFFSMGWNLNEVMFHGSPEVGKQYFSPHDEWELKESSLEVIEVIDNGHRVSRFDVIFRLQRRASFILLNSILPVVSLSLLNLLVFVIPEESGEKLVYGITVLLTLAVYLSIITGLLPRTPGNLPLVNIYIFTLFILSVLAVVDSIVIAYVSNMEEQKHVQRGQAKGKVKSASNRISPNRKADQPFANGDNSGSESIRNRRPSSATIHPPDYFSGQSSEAVDNNEEESPASKYKLIGKYINNVSLVVFLLIWLTLTLGFMITVSM